MSKKACAPNLVQDYFQVKNSTSAPVALSNITIKSWAFDTTGIGLKPDVFYGGCIIAANGSCLHPVTGVTVTATSFAPACGPDPGHQANWEIVLSTTDPTPLANGQTWGNVQTDAHLTNYSNFVPGTADWYSGPCGSGGPYVADTHFAVYEQGNLVDTLGITTPICRAPAVVQIQSFIDQNYYADTDITNSFSMVTGATVDCIAFGAQLSVKDLVARGVQIPAVPALPQSPASEPPPNIPPHTAFNGELDVQGRPRQCPSGTDGAGALGTGSVGGNGQLTPVPVQGLGAAAAVYAGAEHTCALLLAGTVECWGDNENDDIDNAAFPSLVAVPTPEQATDFTGANGHLASLSLGTAATCGMFEDGSVACVGSNVFDQLGSSGGDVIAGNPTHPSLVSCP